MGMGLVQEGGEGQTTVNTACRPGSDQEAGAKPGKVTAEAWRAGD